MKSGNGQEVGLSLTRVCRIDITKAFNNKEAIRAGIALAQRQPSPTPDIVPSPLRMEGYDPMETLPLQQLFLGAAKTRCNS